MSIIKMNRRLSSIFTSVAAVVSVVVGCATGITAGVATSLAVVPAVVPAVTGAVGDGAVGLALSLVASLVPVGVATVAAFAVGVFGPAASLDFIIESLHSLSVDITRLQEGDVPEKTWKAFQKGDIAAFTRRLAKINYNVPVDKLRNKFANDTEFRTYVQRFIRQFEDLYEQAVANDHGMLLGTTFISSDIGKLYELLCHAAGRTPKLNQEDRSKAKKTKKAKAA